MSAKNRVFSGLSEKKEIISNIGDSDAHPLNKQGFQLVASCLLWFLINYLDFNFAFILTECQRTG